MNFTFIEVFIGDRSHIFEKKRKNAINKQTREFLLRKHDSRRDVYLRITGATLSPQFFNLNEGNIDEQTSSRIEAIIHCSSKCRENIASWIFLSISTSKNRQKQSSLFRLRYQIVPLTVEFIAHGQSNLVQ